MANRRPLTIDERAWLKQQIDIRARERAKKIRRIDDSLMRGLKTREQRKQSAQISRALPNTKMTVDEVESAFRSFKDGIPLSTIAARIWVKHEFKTTMHCELSLMRRFTTLGLLDEDLDLQPSAL